MSQTPLTMGIISISEMVRNNYEMYKSPEWYILYLDDILVSHFALHIFCTGIIILFLSNSALWNELLQSSLDYVLLTEFLESHLSNCF